MNNKKLLKQGIYVFAGGLLGFAYYFFIGCSNGKCPISSSPYISTAYGAFSGLIFSLPGRKKNK